MINILVNFGKFCETVDKYWLIISAFYQEIQTKKDPNLGKLELSQIDLYLQMIAKLVFVVLKVSLTKVTCCQHWKSTLAI